MAQLYNEWERKILQSGGFFLAVPTGENSRPTMKVLNYFRPG